MNRGLVSLCAALLVVVVFQGRCASRRGEALGFFAAQAVAARARADSLAARADSSVAVADSLRAERDRYQRATTAAARRVAETTRSASAAVAEAERLAGDSAVALDSLRGAVVVLADAWRADSVAHAAASAAWEARAVQYEFVIAADSAALVREREARLAERVAGMKRAAELEARIPSGWSLAVRTLRDVAIGVAIDRVVLNSGALGSSR